MDEVIIDDNYCFACGKDNPIGLKLPIRTGPDGAFIDNYVIKKEYQGYANIVHGGIISLILDELQVYAAFGKGYKTVTAKIEVRFLKPVKTGLPIRVEAHVKGIKKRGWIETEGLLYQEGVLKAKSSSLLKEVS